MRKKQVATRILSSNDSGRFPQFSLPECNASAQSLVRIEPSVPELPTFSVDSMGNIILPDGTPVVQPAGVDENFGCAVQFDLKDGALPKKSFRSFDNQPSGLDMVKCTSCAIRISPFSVPCEVHPILKVIICKRCSKFYGKGCFAKDADGKDENCRWCGDGGDLICCDTCSNTFCKSCIKRNLGRTFLYNIEELEENEIWSCVLCKPETLLNLQQECSEIIERVRVSNVTRKKRTDRTHSLLKARQSTPQHSPAMNNSPVIVVPAMQTPVTASAIQNIDDLAAVLVSSAGLFPQAADFFKNLQTLNNTPSTIVLTPPVAVTSILPAGTQLPVLPPLPLMTSVSTAVGTCNLIQSSPITVTTSRLASSITSSTSQDSNDSTASMRFNRNKSASTGNNNSPDWYLQNVSVGNILDQIAQVDASNIQQATKALRICLETFICDLRRVETNLAKSRTPTEINNIVRSFQSIYRFHMFNRVGNLVSRINEEGNKLDKIKPSQYHKVTPPVALPHQKQLLQPLKQPVQQKQPISHQLQSKTLSPSVPSPKVGLPKMPIPSKNPLTIDLTDDLDVSMESEPAKESIAIATVQKSLGSQNNGKVPTDTNVASDHGAKRPQNVLISDTYSRKRMRPRRSCTVKPVRYVIADDPDQDNNYRSLLEDQSDKTPLSSNLQNVRQNKMRKPLPINMDCEDSDNNVEETHPQEAKFSDENEKEEVSRTQEAEIPNKAQKERVASETQETEIVSVIQGENVTSETQGAQIVSNTHKEDINSSQPLIPVKITMIQPVMTKNETNSNNLSSEMIWKKNAVNEIAKLTNVININCNNISEKAHLLKASLNENSIVASNEKDNIINNILSKQLENSTKTMNSLSETDEKHKEHSPTHLENRFSKEAGLSSSNSECLFNPPIPPTPRLEISTFLLELPIKQSDSPRSPSSKEEYSTSDLERENNTEEDEVVARNLLLAPSSPSELNSNSDCAMSSKSSSSRLTRSSSHQLDNISEHDDFVIILSDDDESSNSSVNRQSHKKIKEKNAISSSDEEFSIKTKKKLQRCSQRTRSSNALNSDVADKVDNANGKEDVRDSKHRSQRQHATNAALSSSDEESSIKMKKKSQRRIQRAQSSGSLNSDDASKLKSDVSQEKNDDEPTSMPRRKRVADFAFSSSDEEGSLKMKKKSQRGIRRTRSSDNLNSDGADAVESNVSDKEDDYKPTIAPQRKPVGRKIKRRACRRQLSSDDENEDAGEFEKVSSPKKKLKPKSEISVAKKSVEGEENEGGSDGEGKGGRKQIRKIIKMKGLSTETKTAEAVERERLKRLEERQKFYNTIVTEEAASEKSAIPTVLIVFDCKKDSNEPPIKVHSELCAHLKPHQREAVQFLWDSLIESVDEHNQNRDRMSGAILAHCMGLGKSLSTITFIHTLLTHTELLGIRTCLIICPVNTVLNWHSEWRQWTPEDSEINVYEVATTIACKFRLDVIKQWHEKGGVLLLGYDMYRNLTTSLLKRTRKPALKKLIPEALIDPGPDIVVCDEGHLLKNYKAGITKAVSSLKTPKRIVLTGTPLQNNLPEYWTMVNFVKPKLLGTAKEFANRFVNPIKNGQHSNSTARDVQLMKRRAHILFKTLDGCVQRKDYSCLTKYLPPRLEYVLKIRLCQAQQDFYNEFIKNYRPNRVKDDSSRSSLFKDQQTLYRIWTHPHTLRMHETREAKKALLRDSTTEEENSSNSESDEASDSSSSSSSSSDSESHSKGVKSNGVSDNMPPIKNSASGNAKVEKSSTATISTRSGRKVKMHNNNSSIIDLLSSDDDEVQKDDDEEKEEEEKENDKAIRSIVADSSPDVQMSPTVHSADDDDENNISDRKSRLRRRQNGEQKSSVAKPIPVEKQPWWYNLYKEEYDHRIDVGAKLSTLFLLLQKCVDIGDKLLVFSQSLFSLDLIEWFLAAIDRQWCIGQGMDIDGDSVQAAEFEKLKQADKLNDLPSLSDYFSDIGQNIWRRGKDYERIDGSMSAQMRNQLQKRFNNPRDLRFRLLIISTKAGGLGVNLTGANRLVLFDVSWNPSHDIQSIFRSYRFGQAKPVYIYRLIAQGTMEEKMYDRQVTKQSLALRVIDEQQIDRHFKEEDLRELYTFEPDIWDPETASSRIAHILPKDRLFADLLSEHPELISAYHNHDSLLENRIDEGLSESERKEAWREYEDEKQFGRQTDYQRMLVVNSHQHQNIALLQQQQQQMMQMRIQQALGGAGPANLQTTIDRMFAPMSLPTNLVGAPVGQLPVQIPSSQPQRDIFSEAFNAMRTTLLTRYPMLARSPSALHEMTMRLFLTSVASEAQRSVAPVASTTTEENGVASP